MYQVDYARGAHRDLERLARRAPAPDIRALLSAIDALASEPRPRGSAKLEGLAGLYRLRVRDYRVVYYVDDPAQRVIITRVARRAEDTYRRP